MRSLLLGLAVCVACGQAAQRPTLAPTQERQSAAPSQLPAAGGRASATDGFTYATVEKVAATEPKRFSARLPSALSEFERLDQHPPLGQVEVALCRGDASMQERYLAALRAAASRGPIAPELRERLVELTGYCESPTLCSWLVSSLAAATDPGVRGVLYWAVARCGKSALPLLERDDSPDEALIELYFDAFEVELPLSPRLKKAARALAKAWKGEELRRLGVAFAYIRDPGLVDFVLELQRATPVDSRGWLALGLRDHPSSRARALIESACSRPPAQGDPLCQRSRTSTNPPSELLPELGESTGAPHPERAEQLAAQRRFGSRDELIAWLRAQRLIPDAFTPKPPELGGSSDVRSLLTEAERLLVFDAETDQYPNEHDTLLASLAALTGGELADTRFEEVPPPDIEPAPDGPTLPYQLHAYSRGVRYRVQARDFGDWYDLDAVLGLLNSVLLDRGSSFRFLALDTGDQTAHVVTGPKEALTRAVQEGLLRAGKAGTARDTGQAFEEEVFHRIQEFRRE